MAGGMKFNVTLSSLLPLAASVFAMAMALAAQFGLGWKPCELCLLQRIPILLAGLAAVGSLYPTQFRGPQVVLAGLAALFFLGTSVLAAYHVGVEQHWWVFDSSCSRDPTEGQGVIDFAQEMSKPVVVRCDQPPWQWHGITMAAMNVVYSAGVGIMTIGLLIAERRKRKNGNGR